MSWFRLFRSGIVIEKSPFVLFLLRKCCQTMRQSLRGKWLESPPRPKLLYIGVAQEADRFFPRA